jgi:hypothetical protein
MLSVKEMILKLALPCAVVLSACGGGTPIIDDEMPALGAATSSSVPTADTNESPVVAGNFQLQESTNSSGSNYIDTAPVFEPEIQMEQETSVTAAQLQGPTTGVGSDKIETAIGSEPKEQLEQLPDVTDDTAVSSGSQLPITSASVGSEEQDVASESPATQEGNSPALQESAGASTPASAQNISVETAEPELTEPDISSSASTQSLSGQCLDVLNEPKSYGEVTNSTWRSWTSPLNFHYSESPQYLRVVDGLDVPYVQQKFVPAGNGSARVLANAYLPSERTYRLTQSVFFESGFDWGGTEEGGKLGFGFSGGSAPSGGLLQTDGFSARFMWRGNKDGTAKLVLYSYAADRSQNLPYGDDYPLSGFDVPIGEWIDLTMEVTVNSTTSASDGSVRVWANGVLHLERDNIQWQSTGSDPAVQALSYASFYGGNSSAWAPGQTTYARFKNVCWAPVTEGNSAIDPYDTNDINAARLDGQSLDKQIYSDYIESELLTFSPRGKLLSVYRQLELLLPTENYHLDVGLSSILVAISEALVADNWIDNYTLHANGVAQSEIVKAQGLLTMLTDRENYGEFITSQLFQAQDTLGEAFSEYSD